jgi:hypothetical protein
MTAMNLILSSAISNLLLRQHSKFFICYCNFQIHNCHFKKNFLEIIHLYWVFASRPNTLLTCMCYLRLHNKLSQNIVTENKNKYFLTVGMLETRCTEWCSLKFSLEGKEVFLPEPSYINNPWIQSLVNKCNYHNELWLNSGHS